jgi:hypothetical protein
MRARSSVPQPRGVAPHHSSAVGGGRRRGLRTQMLLVVIVLAMGVVVLSPSRMTGVVVAKHRDPLRGFLGSEKASHLGRYRAPDHIIAGGRAKDQYAEITLPPDLAGADAESAGLASSVATTIPTATKDHVGMPEAAKPSRDKSGTTQQLPPRHATPLFSEVSRFLPEDEAGPLPDYFRLRHTPEFSVHSRGQGSTPLELVVPFYISILTHMDRPLEIAGMARKVNHVVLRNDTTATEMRLRIQTVFIDNTGCDRPARIVRETKPHFESHAEMNAKFDCARWLTVKRDELPALGVDVLVPPVPLPFGPTMNMMQRDALDTRGAPRFMWAHHDAAPQSSSVLVRVALVAAFVTDPFCVFFSGPWPANHDVIAVFDAVSLQREVGDWDSYMWYYGDNDYYDRCQLAQLPYGDMERLGLIGHTVSAAKKTFQGKMRRRFETMDAMFEFLRGKKQEAFGTAPPLPPKDSIAVRVSWRDERKADVRGAAVALSRHAGRYMRPYRYMTTARRATPRPGASLPAASSEVSDGALFALSADYIIVAGPQDEDEGVGARVKAAIDTGREAWERAWHRVAGDDKPPPRQQNQLRGDAEGGLGDGPPATTVPQVDWDEAALLSVLSRSVQCDTVTVMLT